jgi:hypothetical protein
MNIGDLVMFVDEGRYSKYFFGQIGTVERYTSKGCDGNAHCRVRWIQPVPYHGRNTNMSDFQADCFKVVG